MYNLKIKGGSFLEGFKHEIEEIGEKGIFEILDSGRRWDISAELRKGGSAIFPHARPMSCGDQVAAVVQGCLDSGSDRVVALGVYHYNGKRELLEARRKEYEGKDISNEACWGIFDFVKDEHSLFLFKALWDAEVKRRGIRSPQLFMRYPNLVNRCPENLLGIEELARMAKDSVVVATADLCHHGVIYSTPKQKILDLGEEGKEYAQGAIYKALRILERGNYHAFYDACIEYKSDGKDTLSVLRYIKGAEQATILDLRLIDTSNYFEGNPKPSWVATSLITLSPVNNAHYYTHEDRCGYYQSHT